MTVRDATAIVVLDNGRVVERGSSDELVALDGIYARLLRLHESPVPEQERATV